MDIEKELTTALKAGHKALTEHRSKMLLKTYGVPTIDETPVPDPDGAADAARKIGFPVVLKAMGPDLTHKTEGGLVRLDLNSEEAVRIAARKMAESAGDAVTGFLVQPQMTGRREFAAGLFRDPQFGPVIMFGAGGVFAEVTSDVTFRLAPLSEEDAEEMLDEIRGGALLSEFRGEAAVDRTALVRTLTGLSRLALDHPGVAEVDINPLKAGPDGDIRAVDALVAPGAPPDPGAFPPPADLKELGRLFHPRSIAFVGASQGIGKWGHMLVVSTISGGFAGDVHLVNPRGGAIAGRKVYKSVSEIPGPVDLAVVTIPAAGVPDLIPQLAEKGIRRMLLISSGFSETGEEGRRREETLVAAAREAGILMVGPNTMGICNPHIDLYCTGAHVRPRAGSTTIVAQSGNMGTQLMGFAEQQGIGIRGFAGSGNEAMVAIEDFLETFEADDATGIAMLYIESVKNGRRFYEAARRIGRKKPIVLLKGGRSDAGNRAAASHTGALASNVRVFDAMCRQAGIIKVAYPMDLLDLSAAFSALPLPRGKRVALMTLGGGWGVVTSDLCAEFGMAVPPLPQTIINRLDRLLPPYWSRANPVDIVGENDDQLPLTIMEELLQWDGCDAVISLGIMGRRNLLGSYVESIRKADPTYTPEFLTAARDRIIAFEKGYIQRCVALMEQYRKPVIGVPILTTEEDQTLYRVEGSRLKAVFYPTPERAVKALSKMCEYQCFLGRCEPGAAD